MASHPTSDILLPEPLLTQLPMHICGQKCVGWGGSGVELTVEQQYKRRRRILVLVSIVTADEIIDIIHATQG